jgi:hypothetical protein
MYIGYYFPKEYLAKYNNKQGTMHDEDFVQIHDVSSPPEKEDPAREALLRREEREESEGDQKKKIKICEEKTEDTVRELCKICIREFDDDTLHI